MVYGVFGGEYSDWYVVGYFENKKDAEDYCKKHNRDADEYGEYYVKPLLNLVDNEPSVYRKYSYSELWGIYEPCRDGLSEHKKRTVVHASRNGIVFVDVWMKLSDYSEDKVRKIARDAIAAYKAEKAGVV